MASLLTPLWDSPPPAAWGPEAALALSPLRAQTDRHTQRVGHSPACFRGGRKQLWEQESAVGAEMWSLTQGSAILWGSCTIRAKVKQRFRCHSSTLPLLAYSEDLPRCRWRAPGGAEHSPMRFLFPYGKACFLKGNMAQLWQARHAVFELFPGIDDSVQAFMHFGFTCHQPCWAESFKLL